MFTWVGREVFCFCFRVEKLTTEVSNETDITENAWHQWLPNMSAD